MRASAILASVSIALGLAACAGKGETKSSVDLTFYLSPTAAPATIVAKQDYVIAWTLFNGNELSGHVDNVAWTVSRDGVPNVFTGTVATIASHQRVPLSLIDNQPIGAHTYVITIDPANTVNEVSEGNNSRAVVVNVLPLVIQ